MSIISDTLPAEVVGAEWTCRAEGGATCPSEAGTGSVEHAADLPVSGKLVYEFEGTLSSIAAGVQITNTVMVSPSGGVRDSDLSNNVDLAVNEPPGLLYLPLVSRSY
jgi:hypothetical protein